MPTHHLNLYEKKPSHKGAIYFNHLPDHLRIEPTEAFKKELTKYLQDGLVNGGNTSSLANLFDKKNFIYSY